MIRAASLPRPTRRRRLRDLLSRIAFWRAVARQRAALAALEPSALDDIGVSRAQAETEAGRPFWDAPDNWRM